ncbi:MAG: nucleotidyltransferase family protein [Thermotogae bacterium]|nr:nucleotidyltransferase family protein [Thermotogota bacterium]
MNRFCCVKEADGGVKLANTKILDLKDIMNILKGCKEEFKKRYGVKEIGIFGSYVRGEQKETSDVDILVEFEPNARISLLDFVKLEDYISDLLGIKVDLVEKSALKPRIGKHILREAIYL